MSESGEKRASLEGTLSHPRRRGSVPVLEMGSRCHTVEWQPLAGSTWPRLDAVHQLARWSHRFHLRD
jgi:hypothetical protein